VFNGVPDRRRRFVQAWFTVDRFPPPPKDGQHQRPEHRRSIASTRPVAWQGLPDALLPTCSNEVRDRTGSGVPHGIGLDSLTRRVRLNLRIRSLTLSVRCLASLSPGLKKTTIPTQRVEAYEKPATPAPIHSNSETGSWQRITSFVLDLPWSLHHLSVLRDRATRPEREFRALRCLGSRC